MNPQPRIPSATGIFSEAWTVLELPRLALQLPSLASQPRGNGEPVLVLPGFGTGDYATLPIRTFLSALGYRVRGWGLGRNTGDARALVPRIMKLISRHAAESGGPVRLVGWSMGGYLAREAAREAPDTVERVVTLGTPVVGGPKYTTVGRRYAQRGYDLDAMEAAVEKRNRVPIRVPITAIYTRSDGIVSWEACIDRFSPDVEHIEVSTTHIGLGLNPDVYRIVAERLAAPPHRSRDPRASASR